MRTFERSAALGKLGLYVLKNGFCGAIDAASPLNEYTEVNVYRE